jgi:hypothetical protein
VQLLEVLLEPYKDTKGVVTVGVGYAFNKDRSEIESDFKAAGIPTSKIDGLMKMDGTQLTPKETASLADVSYDRHGVQKLEKIGIDLESMNPMLAEIGVVQAFRGDIIKGGSGYQGKLYDYLKNNDLDGMTKYVKSSGEVPKEVKQRLNTVVNRYGAKTEEQYKYDTNSTTDKPSVKELFEKVGTVNTDVRNNNISTNVELDPVLMELRDKASNVYKDSPEYAQLQNQYNLRLNDVVNSTRGQALSQYMNRQTSSDQMKALNRMLIDALKSSPEALQQGVSAGDDTRFDMERIMMEDGNRLKKLIQGLNKPKINRELQGKSIVPDRPSYYQQ